MGKRLTIDCGNTATKVAVWDGDDIFVCEAIVSHDLCKELHDLAKIHGRFEASIYSAVSEVPYDLRDTLAEVSEKVIRLTCDTPLPIAINYATPHTLGCDRIAGAVGAMSVVPDGWRLIVDMGTAITYDLLTPENVFMGGNITAGLKMRLRALHDQTAMLPETSIDGPCPEFGYDTDTALRAGAIRGIVAELKYFASNVPEPSRVIVTGGRTKVLAPYIDPRYIIYPHLVNKGLNSIITYNENI